MESSANFAVGGKRPYEDDDDPNDAHQLIGNGFQNNGIDGLSPATSRRKKGGPGSSNRTGQACDRCKVGASHPTPTRMIQRDFGHCKTTAS